MLSKLWRAEKRERNEKKKRDKRKGEGDEVAGGRSEQKGKE